MRRTDTAARVIAAPAEVIYAAFARAEAVMSWLPPGRMTGRALEYDFREGGRYRIELTYDPTAPPGAGKTTGRTDVSRGRFLSLLPGKRVVQSVEFESTDAAFAGEMIITWDFEAAGSGTRVTVRATNVPDCISQDDHDAGLKATLDNLARHCRG